MPILLGDAAKIHAKTAELGLNLEDVADHRSRHIAVREGLCPGALPPAPASGRNPAERADKLMNDRNIFASMMVHMGDADALVSGVTQHYPETIRPALQIIGMREGLHRVAGCTR